MKCFNSEEIIQVSPDMIPFISKKVEENFSKQNYTVTVEDLYSGGKIIHLSKGKGIHSVLGTKKTLNVKLTPTGRSVKLEAKASLLGTQAVPTLIMLLAFWPVLITQIYGLVKQAHLDDEALDVAKKASSQNNPSTCSHCGQKIDPGFVCCPICGTECA